MASSSVMAWYTFRQATNSSLASYKSDMTSQPWDIWDKRRPSSYSPGIITGRTCGSQSMSIYAPATLVTGINPHGTFRTVTYIPSPSLQGHVSQCPWTSLSNCLLPEAMMPFMFAWIDLLKWRISVLSHRKLQPNRPSSCCSNTSSRPTAYLPI